MRYNAASEIAERGLTRASAHARGLGRGVSRFSSHRAAEIAIPASSRMPVALNETALQDGSGNTLFTLGFSELDGGHILG